jgi:GNAT superfamily N-acetyltransferase
MQITLRPACDRDLAYCESLYFSAMERTIRELKLDMTAHVANFHDRWEAAQVRIITVDSADVGWLQSAAQGDTFFLGQLFVDSPFQRRGIGTEVMKILIGEATREHRAMTLGVVKANPARRLYERLGFHITHHDDRKFYMRRDLGIEAPI